MLLDAWGGERSGELLDVGGDHHGLDLVEDEAPLLAPGGEASRGGEVGEPGVGVSDMGGEELPETALGVGEGEKSTGAADALRGQGAGCRSGLRRGWFQAGMGRGL